SGSGGGEFQKPVDVAVDGSQNVYVTDETGEVVQKFDKDGAFLAMWGKNVDGTGGHTCTASCSGGTFGTAEGDFYYPEGIGIGGDKIYVVDSLNNRVEQFSTAGSFIRTFGWGVSGGSGFEVCTSSCQAGVPGSGGGQFDHPQRVGVDPGGNPYVSDTGNNRIERFGDIHIAHDGSELESMLLACSAYDTILLQPGDYTLSGPSNLGGFVIAPDPATNGNARNITIDAQNSGRAFTVNFGWNSVSGVTIKNGLSHSDGGAIQVQDGRFLYLQDSTVTRNQSVNDGTARTWGGGIFNSGELHTMNVTFSQNTSGGEDVAGRDAFGGAIATAVDTTTAHTYLINTTISGNTANQGEGAVNATAAGGGIYTDGASTTEVYGSTIAGNTVSGAQAGSGGGGNIFDEMPVFDGTYLSDTIVAQGASNRAGSENCAVGSGAMVSRGGNVEDRDQCGLTLASDQKNTNPLLGPLQDNGGPIDTRAIPLTSPAVDRALNGPCNVFDARGSARKTAQDPLCDGGAFEAGSKPSSTGGGERPKCTLKPAGSKVKAPKPRTLKLKVVCDRVAALKLAGKLTLKPKKKKGAKKKPKAKKFSVSTSGNATQAGKQVTLTVKVSKKAIKLLKKKAKGSAAFRLTASNANGSTTTPAKIKKLKLVVKKKKHKKH
ncbi:MAG: tripartite motif-containing protein 71, partial [Thermoleophilaceae bacterium]|nr:tripartite motif-containing protein 71 [Thermoleophilaceae bacterium]